MAGHHVTDRPFDASISGVIEAYLHEVDTKLVGPAPARGDIIAELRDGLSAAVETHLEEDACDPAEAARLAVREFGLPSLVAAGFSAELAARQARRVGLGLMASGPLVGGVWLAALGTWPSTLLRGHLSQGWSIAPLYGVILAVAVPAAVLAVVATGPLERWMPELPRLAPSAAALGAGACVAGDLTLLLMFAASPMPVATGAPWPLLLALAPLVSLARLVGASQGLRHCLALRARLS